MGSLTNVPQNFAAFQNQIFPNGLDLGRCTIQQDIGAYYAAPGAVFQQGSLVALDSVTQMVVPFTGAGTSTFLLGVVKWAKAPSINAAVADEPVTFTVGAAPQTATLKHPNVANVALNSAPQMGGTLFIGDSPGAGTDYTVNTTNGIITTVAAGALTPTLANNVYYATYTWTLSAADLYQFQGLNFWNFTDNVSIQDNRVTVITDWSMLFTTQYDTAVEYTIGQQLVATSGGLFGTAASVGTVAGANVGRVFQLPGVNDPFLGIISGGNPL
jgi:hypothetical protein